MLQIAQILLMRQGFNVIYPRGDNGRSHVTKQLFSIYRLNIKLNQISQSIFVANQSIQLKGGVKRL